MGDSDLHGKACLFKDIVVAFDNILGDGGGVKVDGFVVNAHDGVVVLVLFGVLADEVTELKGQIKLQLLFAHIRHGDMVSDNDLRGKHEGAGAGAYAVFLEHILDEISQGGGGGDSALTDEIFGQALNSHFRNGVADADC